MITIMRGRRRSRGVRQYEALDAAESSRDAEVRRQRGVYFVWVYIYIYIYIYIYVCV